MRAFGRHLSVLGAQAVMAGLAFGQIAPGAVGFVATFESGSVNVVVAALIRGVVSVVMVGASLALGPWRNLQDVR